MKRYLSPLFLLVSLAVNGQDAPKTETTPKIRWIQVQGGGGMNNAHDMRDQLNTPSIDETHNLYVNYSNLKGFYGGGLSGMIAVTDKLLLGASFNYNIGLSQTNAIAKFNNSSYTGMVTFGEILYNKNNLLIYPYLGAGYSNYTLKIENKSTSTDVGFDLNNPIKPGNSAKYTTDYIMFELGVGVKKTFGNLALGLDGGIYFSSTYGGEWKNGSTTVTSRKAPGTNGGFVRLTIGFGRFQ